MEREELARKVGINIRKYRLSKDISQEALSLSAGLNPAYIGRLERGEKCPTIDTLYRICEALKITLNEILSFEDQSQEASAEAKNRIDNALSKMTAGQQIKAAEIIENISDILNDRSQFAAT